MSEEKSPAGGDDAELVEVVVLDELFLLVRSVSTHGADHDDSQAIARELHAHMVDAEPPYRLAFFAGGVYRDGEYLPMGIECHRRIEALSGMLAARGVQQLVIQNAATPRELLGLVETLLAHPEGSDRLPLGPAGVDLVALPAGRFGALPEPDYGEPFATAQTERALKRAAELTDASSSAWPFAVGRAVAHSLDWAAEVSRPAAWRVLELGVGSWSRERRTAAAGLHVAATLCWLGVDAPIRRAAVHAVLAMAAHGLAERAGADALEAATRALESFGRTEPDPRFGFDGHRLRTTAILRGIVHSERVNAENRVAPLCMLGYELERQRCPEGLDLELTKLDLFAWLAQELGGAVHPQWGRAMFASHGVIPVGAHVLADGRLGVAVAPRRGQPWAPLTLVGGELVIPATDVDPSSPLAG